MITTFTIWFLIAGVVLLALSQLVYHRQLEKDLAAAAIICFILAGLTIFLSK